MSKRSKHLPPPLDLLWGSRNRALRRETLSVEGIVGAAVELADAGGLEAVSMNRVAERLGFTTMSLYRHVRNKDELVALMVEEAASDAPEVDEVSPPSWRSDLDRWGRALLEMLRRHPWVLDAPVARLPLGPNRLAWLDGGLRALSATPLTEDEKASVVLLLNGYVFGQARFSAELGDLPPDAGTGAEMMREQGELLNALVDPERFPALRRAIDAGIFDPSDGDRDADFVFGLERILDGIDRLIEGRSGAAG